MVEAKVTAVVKITSFFEGNSDGSRQKKKSPQALVFFISTSDFSRGLNSFLCRDRQNQWNRTLENRFLSPQRL